MTKYDDSRDGVALIRAALRQDGEGIRIILDNTEDPRLLAAATASAAAALLSMVVHPEAVEALFGLAAHGITQADLEDNNNKETK